MFEPHVNFRSSSIIPKNFTLGNRSILFSPLILRGEGVDRRRRVNKTAELFAGFRNNCLEVRTFYFHRELSFDDLQYIIKNLSFLVHQ